MAGQKIAIDILTSYKGQGINEAQNGVSQLGAKVADASGKVGGLLDNVGKLIPGLKGITGPASTVAKGIGGITTATKALGFSIKGLLGPIGLVIGALTIVKDVYDKFVSERKAKTEELKKAEEEATKARIEKWEKAADRIKQKHEEEKKKADELADAYKRLLKAKKDAYNVEANDQMALQRQLNEDAVINASEDDKGVIQALGNKNLAKQQGEYDKNIAMMSYRDELNKLMSMDKSDKDYKTQEAIVEKAGKHLEAVYQRVERTLDNADAAILQAEQERSHNEADALWEGYSKQQEQMLKQIEADRKEREEKNLQSAKDDLRDALLEKLDQVKVRLSDVKNEIKKLDDTQSRINNGMQANNASTGNGWNGGNRYDPYQYHPDANGNLNPGEVARANRMNAGGERDNKSKRMGPNARANAEKKYQDLWDRAQFNPQRMSNKDWRDLENLRDWRNQDGNGEKRKSKKEQQKQLEQEQKQYEQDLKNMPSNVQEIRNKLDEITKLK